MLLAIAINDKAAMRGEAIPFNRVGLGSLCNKFNVVNSNAHDALADALAEAEVYRCSCRCSREGRNEPILRQRPIHIGPMEQVDPIRQLSVAEPTSQHELRTQSHHPQRSRRESRLDRRRHCNRASSTGTSGLWGPEFFSLAQGR